MADNTVSDKCDNDFSIRQMTTDHIAGALRVFASHGLFEANYSVETYLKIDGNGFYVAIDDITKEVIGVCGGPMLRPDLAFIGLYAVDQRYSGRRIGQKLFHIVLSYIGNQQNVALFSVPDKLGLYRDRLGFRVVSDQTMVIYTGTVANVRQCSTDADSDDGIHVLTQLTDDLIDRQIVDYDRHIHGLSRDRLLGLSLRESGCRRAVAVDNNNKQVMGYGCLRVHSSGATTLSPLYADSPQVAKRLLSALVVRDDSTGSSSSDSSNVLQTKNQSFYYYTLHTNPMAIELAEQLGLDKHEECRLLFRKRIVPVNYEKIYSILSPNFSL
ncbi:uncharacterized protein LOC128952974 [Oppia nitens]|uniref:uncharacterized protein LOC128952974 n=1 Tax=Oppia nitens TaxID=1686743 RepID=UPI0023DBCC69|nr:uncharacterized protein LOC128952974 [Oppia nitens]